MINFTQLNLHKSSHATLLAGQALESKQFSVALLTEPHMIGNKLHGFPRGTTQIYHRTSSDQPAGRAAIVASNDLGLTALGRWCNRDCAVALLKINHKPTILASIYMDITKPMQPAWLDGHVNMAEDKGFGLLVAMDSNAHSSLFGPTNNARGDQLEDFIMHHGLSVENTGNTPTFETRRGACMIETFIDVTLSRDVPGLVSRWTVDRGYNASDHNTIRFSIESVPRKKTQIRPWSKADWPLFSKHLANANYRIPEGISMKKLDRLLQRLYDLIEEGLDKACPKVYISGKIHTGHWATEEHAQKKSEVAALYKKARLSGTNLDWETYKQADKKFKRLCKKDKNKAWRLYKETIQTTKETANLVKLAQRNDRADIQTLKKADGSSTTPGQDTVDLLRTTHFPAASGTRHVTYNNRRNLPSEDIGKKYCDWISEDLVQRALLGFEKKKSPGPDDIKPLLFEHLPHQFISTLTFIYKSCIHLGYTPKLWKQTTVIFISKPGKEDYLNPRSFRPISLSNYLLKGLERLVGWRMDRALLSNPLHHKQHGFLTGKSTESAISNTVDYIEKFIMQRQHCVGVFLDISSAFDSIKPGHVRQALLKHGGDPDLVQWYHGYMIHRDIHITMHGDKVTFSTSVGFPQGGVCSAKFWLIAFDYAIQIINRYQIEGNGYADDCAALYGGIRLDHALKRLQKMLDELTAWGKTCGLQFNPDKSVAIIFTRRRKKPPFQLKIDGKNIEFKQEVRYLGITLDSKLYWNSHIEDKLSKTKRFLHQVACITRNNWGPKPKLMRWAFIGVVRPMLCYGAMIWGHRAPECIAKLRRINRMAINTFANFPKSTPTTALEVMLDVMPLHLFCLREGLATKLRLQHITRLNWRGDNKNKTHSTSHLRHWENMLTQLGIDITETDNQKPTWTKRRFKLNRSSFDGKAKHRTPTQCNIYTDGSRINEQTGCGYSVFTGSNETKSDHFRLPDYATVFQAEIVAVRQACLSLLRDNSSIPRFIKIFIDSQSAILAAGGPDTSSVTVQQTIDSLNQLASKAISVTLVWIPAHRGHRGNERADELAKMGASTTDADKLLRIPMPPAVVRQTINKAVYGLWTQEWSSQPAANHSRGFYDAPCPNKAKHVYKLSRLELGRFVRIISGHNNLNFFQTKIGLWGDPLCRFCGEGLETITHLLTSCPCFYAERRDILDNLIPSADRRWSVRSLLNFSYIPGINLAMEGTWAHSDPPMMNAMEWNGSDNSDEAPTSSRDSGH